MKILLQTPKGRKVNCVFSNVCGPWVCPSCWWRVILWGILMWACLYRLADLTDVEQCWSQPSCDLVPNMSSLMLCRDSNGYDTDTNRSQENMVDRWFECTRDEQYNLVVHEPEEEWREIKWFIVGSTSWRAWPYVLWFLSQILKLANG